MYKSIRFGLLPIALALVGPVRADDKAPATPAPSDAAAVSADNKQLSDELAASWKETEHLKADLAAAQAACAKSDASVADLQKQLEAAKVPPSSESDTAKQLADAQDKLAISLRSYSVVQDENAQLKASVDKLTSDNAALTQQLDAARASIATLQVTAAATSQIEPLRTQVRQAQDETSRLAAENSELRTRLALQSTAPGSNKPSPTRPGQAQSLGAPTLVPTPTPTPAPKTYVVVEGDTLSRIAKKFYGSSARWEDILKANRDVMKDEKNLVVGSTLKIPE